jgi:serine/threonine-protein kinase
MGVVFSAHDIPLERTVAIKVLLPTHSYDKQFVARFDREARLTASLEHPNVAPVYAAGWHANRPFMVMKYLEGETLASWLTTKGPPDVKTMLHIMRQLCEGLEFIHTRGLIHRDIKLGNVMLGPSGKVTILDFGILKQTDGSVLTTTGLIMGTLNYISPEQIRGGEKIDHRSDLYALGLLLYQLCTGKNPFRGDSEPTILNKHLHVPPEEFLPGTPTVNPHILDVVHRAVSKEPRERFDSANELFQALEAACDLAPTAHRPAKQATRRTSGTLRTKLLIATAISALIVVWALRSDSLFDAPEKSAASPAPAVRVVLPTAPPPTLPAPSEAPKKAIRNTAPSKKRGRNRQSARQSRVPSKGKLNLIARHDGEPVWASVFLDDAPLGTSPISIDVSAGSHTVRVERPGFKTVVQKIDVKPGRANKIQLELRK